jgi:hypothetical protein
MPDTTQPISWIESLSSLLRRPGVVFAAQPTPLRHGALTVLLLTVAGWLRVALEIYYTTQDFGQVGRGLLGTAFGIVLAWMGLASLYTVLARVTRGAGAYRRLLAALGLAALPMALTTLLSSLIYLLSPVLIPGWGGDGWMLLHLVVGWIGMTWGWLGFLGFYAVKHGGGLSSAKAAIIVVLIYLMTLSGWLIPFVLPEIFR